MNDVILGSDGLGFLVILNKSSELRFGLRQSELGFEFGRSQSSCLLRGAHARWLSQWVESWRWTNSQHRKIVSLSPCVEKPKLKEGNKSFVPEPRESSVFCVFRIPIRVWTFYEDYERLIHPYICIVVSWLCYITMALNTNKFRYPFKTGHGLVCGFCLLAYQTLWII